MRPEIIKAPLPQLIGSIEPAPDTPDSFILKSPFALMPASDNCPLTATPLLYTLPNACIPSTGTTSTRPWSIPVLSIVLNCPCMLAFSTNASIMARMVMFFIVISIRLFVGLVISTTMVASPSICFKRLDTVPNLAAPVKPNELISIGFLKSSPALTPSFLNPTPGMPNGFVHSGRSDLPSGPGLPVSRALFPFFNAAKKNSPLIF